MEMALPSKCSIGAEQCRFEFSVNLAQLNQAYRVAEMFSMGKSPYGIATYPYIWQPTERNGTIRMEMGRAADGKRIVALFTMKQVPTKPGAIGHIAVFAIDEKLAAEVGVDAEFASTVVTDIHLHTEAFKHFRGQLLRLDLGIGNGYVVNVPESPPPPPPAEALPPPSRFEDLL